MIVLCSHELVSVFPGEELLPEGSVAALHSVEGKSLLKLDSRPFCSAMHTPLLVDCKVPL